MTVDWSNVWEVALLAVGGAAAWLYFGMGWHRLNRAPRRRQVFSPLVGGALLIAMILAGQAGASIAIAAFNISAPTPDAEPRTLSDVAQIAVGMYAAQGIVLLAYIHLLMHARRPLNDNRLKPAQAVALGLGALVLFWPMVHVVGWIATRIATQIVGPVNPLAHDTLALLVASEPDVWFVLMIFLVVVAAPVLEEVLYRGVLQETLGQLGMGNWTAIFVTSAIFAVMHAPIAPPWALVSLFVLSLGFGWAYEKTGRLAAPIVMHILFNGGNIVLAMASS